MTCVSWLNWAGVVLVRHCTQIRIAEMVMLYCTSIDEAVGYGEPVMHQNEIS